MIHRMSAGIVLSALVLGTFATASAGPRPAPAVAGANRPTIEGSDSARAVQWRIDRSHSEMSFRVRHLVSRVRGTFGDWGGSIVADPDDWSSARVDVTVRTASVDTQNERRDNHLRTNDFFDIENHPTMTFRSTRVEREGDVVHVHGDLTLRGVTRPVVLEGRFLGMTTDQRGKRRAGFEAGTTINRMDYNVSWNRAAEGGGVVLGDEVTIDLVIAAVEQ